MSPNSYVDPIWFFKIFGSLFGRMTRCSRHGYGYGYGYGYDYGHGHGLRLRLRSWSRSRSRSRSRYIHSSDKGKTMMSSLLKSKGDDQ